jgi:hypothetical protein
MPVVASLSVFEYLGVVGSADSPKTPGDGL